MGRAEFIDKVREAVNDYIASEESYGDNAQLQISPADFALEVTDSDDEESDKDYIDIMELLEMDADGKWKADIEAIGYLADDYFEA